jgi:hypothetical protein
MVIMFVGDKYLVDTLDFIGSQWRRVDLLVKVLPSVMVLEFERGVVQLACLCDLPSFGLI